MTTGGPAGSAAGLGAGLEFEAAGAGRGDASGRLNARVGRGLRPTRGGRRVRDIDPDRRACRLRRACGLRRGRARRRRLGAVRFGGVGMAANAQQALLELAVRREPARLDDAINAPVDHDGDVFGDRRRHPDVLLDDEDRHVGFLSQTQQHLLDLRHDHRRETLGRFVHDQELRIRHQRARNRQHLLLAAGKLRAAVVSTLGQAGEGVVDAFRGPGAALARLRHAQMLVDRQRAPQPPPLRHVSNAKAGDSRGGKTHELLATHADRAARGADETHDRLAERRLAHAVAADDRHDAVVERQVDALQCMRVAIIDVEAPDLEHDVGLGATRLSHARLRDKAPEPRDRLRSPAASLP